MERNQVFMGHGKSFYVPHVPPSLVPFAHTKYVRHEAKTRTYHMAGISNLLTCATWEEAVDCYTKAFQERRLIAIGKIQVGQHATIENIRFS